MTSSSSELSEDELTFDLDDDLIPVRESCSPGEEPEEGDIAWGEPNESEIPDFLGFDLSNEETVDRSGLNALINSAIVAQRRMPMLDVVFDRTARRMTRSLRQLTDENLEVSLQDVATSRFGDFLHGHERASVIGVLHSETLDAYGLIVTDASLMLAVLDLLLGGRRGDAGFFDDFRPLTQIELGLAERILNSVIDDFNAALTSVFEADFRLDRIETTPRFAAIAQEPSVCATGKFEIRVGERKAHASIILPNTVLEPVSDALRRDFIGERTGGDELWRQRIDSQMRAARVEISAVLAEKEMALDALKELSVGDLIVFAATPGIPVSLAAGGRRIVTGRLGRAGDRIAVCLQSAPERDVALAPLLPPASSTSSGAAAPPTSASVDPNIVHPTPPGSPADIQNTIEDIPAPQKRPSDGDAPS